MPAWEDVSLSEKNVLKGKLVKKFFPDKIYNDVHFHVYLKCKGC